MPLTPIDVTQKTFRERMKGYDEDEVDDFLDEVMVSLREYEQKLRDAEERVSVLEGQLTANRETEDTLKRALVAAQRTADDIVAEARTEADRIIAEASSQAELVAAERSAEKSQLELEVERMRADVADMRAKLQEFAAGALALVPDVGTSADVGAAPDAGAPDVGDVAAPVDAASEDRGDDTSETAEAGSLTERVAALRHRVADEDSTSEIDITDPDVGDESSATGVAPTGWLEPPPEAAEVDAGGRRPWERGD